MHRKTRKYYFLCVGVVKKRDRKMFPGNNCEKAVPNVAICTWQYDS